MRKPFKRLFLAVMVGTLIGGLSSVAYAFDHAFRLAQISVFQKDGNTFSGMLTYNPGFELLLPWRADLGVSLFKSAAGEKNRNVVLNARLLADLRLSDSWSWEVGPGIQHWVNNGDLKFLAGTNLVLHTKNRVLGIADQFFVGYNLVPIKNLYTHEILVGFGI